MNDIRVDDKFARKANELKQAMHAMEVATKSLSMFGLACGGILGAVLGVSLFGIVGFVLSIPVGVVTGICGWIIGYLVVAMTYCAMNLTHPATSHRGFGIILFVASVACAIASAVHGYSILDALIAFVTYFVIMFVVWEGVVLQWIMWRVR